jgi:hypothetical protein
MRWRPLTSFLQTMIDMKNAQTPGAYRAYAHDYRPDLARFIRAVFALPASEEQMARVEAALIAREAARARLLARPKTEPKQQTPEASASGRSRGLPRWRRRERESA